MNTESITLKKQGRGLGFLSIVLLLAIGFLLYRYGEHWLRLLLLYLSHAPWARQVVGDLPLARRVAARFVAGETINEALLTALTLNRQGMAATLDYLGESVTTEAEAAGARDEILRLLQRIEDTGVDANVSVKLSQLGLKLDATRALENVRCIVERASQVGNRIRIDMEDSSLVDKTLEIYRTLRQEGFTNVGAVIQAYLYRSEADVRQLIQEGASVRLCKGAYAEPAHIAFPVKADTDANYVRLMQLMLGEEARQKGVKLAVATHDEAMVQATINFARDNGISADEFEFQMLHGIRRELQRKLVQQGYQVRIYVPYGRAWYPYLMRRLAERPANIWFFVSNFVRR
jgi:proline dehydrogenase